MRRRQAVRCLDVIVGDLFGSGELAEKIRKEMYSIPPLLSAV